MNTKTSADAPPSTHSELKEALSYFERGCMCERYGFLPAPPDTATDEEALAHYEAGCRCTRTYIVDAYKSATSQPQEGGTSHA